MLETAARAQASRAQASRAQTSRARTSRAQTPPAEAAAESRAARAAWDADEAEPTTASDRLLLTLGANTTAVTLLAMTAVAATGRQTLRDTAIAALAGWGFSVAAVSMTSRRHPSRRRILTARVLVSLGFAASCLGAGVVWAAAPSWSGRLAAVALLLGAAALALNYLAWMPRATQSRNSLQ